MLQALVTVVNVNVTLPACHVHRSWDKFGRKLAEQDSTATYHLSGWTNGRASTRF
jgi:hypothetical protein